MALRFYSRSCDQKDYPYAGLVSYFRLKTGSQDLLFPGGLLHKMIADTSK